ncbi:179_t:CDS:2, partial [Entrophospora sp. SA101]
YLVTELQKDFNNLYFERKIDDDLITPGNQEELLPCYLYKTFSEIHNSNLLNVKTQNIDVKRLLVDDGEYQITQIPTIVTGSADKSVKFTSLLTGETFNIFEFHKAGVLSIDFHPIYKNLMLTSSIDSTCALIDVTNMEIIQPFKDHKKYVIKAKFSPDGNFI